MKKVSCFNLCWFHCESGASVQAQSCCPLPFCSLSIISSNCMALSSCTSAAAPSCLVFCIQSVAWLLCIEGEGCNTHSHAAARTQIEKVVTHTNMITLTHMLALVYTQLFSGRNRRRWSHTNGVNFTHTLFELCNINHHNYTKLPCLTLDRN